MGDENSDRRFCSPAKEILEAASRKIVAYFDLIAWNRCFVALMGRRRAGTGVGPGVELVDHERAATGRRKASGEADAGGFVLPTTRPSSFAIEITLPTCLQLLFPCHNPATKADLTPHGYCCAWKKNAEPEAVFSISFPM